MRKTVWTLAALLVLVGTQLSSPAAADGVPVVRAKRVQVCRGPHCGPYAPCGVNCRRVCPDRYSCGPLYGAYGPYGGTGYFGAFTFTGWGARW
ncbi:MAG: hypothetical protein ACJ8F3_11235 [Xanthobacteraceae bacterium]